MRPFTRALLTLISVAIILPGAVLTSCATTNARSTSTSLTPSGPITSSGANGARTAAARSTAAEISDAFIDSGAVDLMQYLPAPPALGSIEAKADLKELLRLQKTRTLEQVAKAQADVVEEIWRFSDVVNDPKFTKENLPVLAAFFSRVVRTEDVITEHPKQAWHRLRPYAVSQLIRPAVKLSKSGSYPSGHATGGTMLGILLARMIPEKRTEILARATEFANNRAVAGVHFPSDIVAGRISGSVIVATLLSRPDFQEQFAAAQNELRRVLPSLETH